ncbi:MAG TPA: alpha/beta hydrolase [Syntrophorhabdaceae bacterium]|nr:alpha/beta hydrolase [Syntrophorhabdaceae bacterium]
MERRGQGERIVFVHGSGWNARMWYKQKDALKSLAEVILVDLPGHGKSAGDGLSSVEEYSAELYRALKEIDLKGYYVAGHSLGGAIAMTLTLSHPDEVKGIILVGTGAKLKVLPEILKGVSTDKERTLKRVSDLAFSRQAPSTLKKDGFNETMKCRAEVIYRDFSACDRFNIMDSVNSLKTPALILCGTYDSLTPPKYSHYLHQAIEGSHLVLVEGAGHLVMIEEPQQVNQAIEEFVKSR